MNTPLCWIRDYVPDLDCTDEEYDDRMTLAGTKVENFRRLDKNLEKIVVGRIVEVRPHPNADRLVVCTINVGDKRAEGVNPDGNVQMVTGAPNITPECAGKLVPVVLSGGKVATGHEVKEAPEDGIVITMGKLRGVDSYGMLCSIEELGSDRFIYPDAPEDGIYIFSDKLVDELKLKPGDDAVEALGMRDTVFEYEITSNRVDCYSIIGIAREAAAVFDKKFVLPKVEESGSIGNIHDFLKVRVENHNLCPRYTARMVKNIHFAPSPEWMQKRLRNAGVRPINNLVDITNFVMLEYGQPMHAFDYDTLAGHEIVVKTAHEGDTFQTLDGQIRKLSDTVLMINDAEKPVGIAGIMGGENSKITDNVHTVVFESANFNGTNIRFSAKGLGLDTDASSLNGKGLDPALCYEANNRACELVEELGCGEVVSGIIDIYPEPEKERRIKFEPEKINNILGFEFNRDEMLHLFKKIELKFDEKNDEIIIPSFRRDLFETCDLSEEVMRLYGYDKITDTLPVGEATTGKLSFKLRVDEVMRNTVEYAGFSHILTYAFESPRAYDMLMIPKDDPMRNALRISNPLGEDFSIMRTQPLNAMLGALGFNYNHKNSDVWLYDLANIYIPKDNPPTVLPDEREELCLGAFGEDVDFYTMKGAIEDVFAHLGMSKRYILDTSSERPYLHPSRKADIIYEGANIGYLGEVHPKVASAYGFKDNTRLYVAVLDIPAILGFVSFDRKYESVVRFPAVSRDLSMLVPAGVLAGRITDTIYDAGGDFVENVELFDIYEGSQVESGYKSMAYTISLRAKSHTLKDSEIVSIMENIVSSLSTLGISLRS